MTQLISVTLFSLHILIPIVIVLSIMHENEGCSLTFKNDIVLQVAGIASNSEVKCLNRTEVEKEKKHMALSVGAYMILCASLDPIEFYFEGDNMTPLMDIFVSRYFPSNQKTFKLAGGIYQGNTGRYGCRKIHNTSYHNSAHLFVSEMAPPYLLQSGLTLEIFCDEDIILLPCKSGNAFSSVHLYKIIRNKELLMENSKNSLWYDRTKGFYLNTTSYSKSELYGPYICRTDTGKTDYIKFNLHPPKGYRVSPDSDKLEVRRWGSVHLKCQTNECVGFKWDHEILKESDVNITSKIKEGSKLKVSQEIVIPGSVLQNLSAINISCGSHYNWMLAINADGIHPDDLKVQLSDSAYSINCTSPKTTPTLNILPCTNRVQCDIRASCFQRVILSIILVIYVIQTFQNSINFNKFTIYKTEMSPPYLLQSGSTLEIFAEEEIILLPCVSGNAFSSVHLYKIFEDKEELMANSINSLWYDRTKGFFWNISSYSEKAVFGQYICRTDDTGITDFIKFNLLPPKGFRVSPDSDELSVRPWNSLHLTCLTDKFVGFQWDFTMLSKSKVNITDKITNSPKLKVLQELFVVADVLQNISKINISCGSYHTWIVTIDTNAVPPDDLIVKLSTSGAPIDCVSPKTIPKLLLFPCSNRKQCDVRAKCFQRGDDCNYITKVRGRRCWTPNCNFLISPPEAGIINCSVGDTVKIVQYFTAFDQKRYAVDTYAPISSILQLNLTNAEETIYSKADFLSTCEAVGFIFSGDIAWAFGMRNGNVVYLNNKVDYNDTEKQGELELISRTSSFLAYSMDIVKLFCFAPLINSTDGWTNTSIEIEVIESKMPAIINEVTEYVFIAGDTNKNIICLSDGTPTAEVNWQLDDNNIVGSLTVLNNDAGVAVLNFPIVNTSHAGNYSCIASNFRGTTFKSFIVAVEFSNVDLAYDQNKNYKKVVTGVGIAGVFVALTLLFGLGYLYKSLWDSKKLLRELTTTEVEEFLKGIENAESSESPLALPYDQSLYEVPMENFEISTKLLGSGAYGKVFSGEISQNGTKTAVAIKTVNENADVIYFKAILSELKIMIYIGSHRSVVRFIGAHTNEIRKRKILLLMEFCPNGDLLNFLREHRDEFYMKKTALGDNTNDTDLSEFHLKSWTLQIAEGMEYLSSKKIVHGDLAARNILLANDLLAKITDFGLSKQLYEDTMYMKKKSIPVPWRWISIEGIKDMTFSSESDMWSYGILMWEIFSLGEVPYPGINYDQSFIKKLQSGFRNVCPEYASPKLYRAMERAWCTDPKNRPTFSEMVGLLHLAEVDENDFNYTTL